MRVQQTLRYALRVSCAQNEVAGVRNKTSDKFVLPSAVLLAGFGITLSSFSVKQMLARGKRRF